MSCLFPALSKEWYTASHRTAKAGARMVRLGMVDRQVEAWLRGPSAGNLFLSVIVIQELEIGVLLAERRDRAGGALLGPWLDDHVLSVFADRILPVDAAVARRSALAQRPRSPADPRRADRRHSSRPRHGRRHAQRCGFRTDRRTILNPWAEATRFSHLGGGAFFSLA